VPQEVPQDEACPPIEEVTVLIDEDHAQAARTRWDKQEAQAPQEEDSEQQEWQWHEPAEGPSTNLMPRGPWFNDDPYYHQAEHMTDEEDRRQAMEQARRHAAITGFLLRREQEEDQEWLQEGVAQDEEVLPDEEESDVPDGWEGLGDMMPRGGCHENKQEQESAEGPQAGPQDDAFAVADMCLGCFLHTHRHPCPGNIHQRACAPNNIYIYIYMYIVISRFLRAMPHVLHSVFHAPCMFYVLGSRF